METTQQNTQLIPINVNEIQKILKDAPSTLLANIDSKDRAIKAADDLIKAKEKVGMNENLDNQMSGYISKANKTIKTLNERRKSFTQMMDELKKKFTGCESDIKAKVDIIQGFRNEYATEQIRLQQEKERLAALKIAKEKERNIIIQQVKDDVSTAFFEYVKEKKEASMKYLNSITLEDFEDKSTAIKDSPIIFTPAQLKGLKLNSSIITAHHTQEEINAIVQEILSEDSLHIHYSNQYSNIMSAHKRQLVDRLPSLKKELEALAVANEEEQKRIEAERVLRIKAEKETILTEVAEQASEQLMQNKVETATANATVTMNNMFCFPSVSIPKVKVDVEIEVLNNAAYALLFQYWFERKGKDMDASSIEKMTIARIKKFCEDYIRDTGEEITSPLLKIKDRYKAK